MKKCVLFFLCCVLVQLSLEAQSRSGFSGTITDSKSHAVAGASVHLLNTNLGTVTNQQGHFSMEQVFAGNYMVEVSAIGYATISREVNITTGNTDVSFTLTEASRQLDEVVVSAQKKEEIVQRLPLSITTLSARNVEEYRLWNNKDLTAIAPNLYSADPGDKRNVTSVRGITTTSYDPAVATYIDGVNQFGLDTYIAQLFDVERIEILRGPQGTLYGRNAMGGVINIITKRPSNTTQAFAEINIGNYGQQRYTAGVETALIKDKLFFGAAGLYEGSNGFYTNQYNNTHYDKQHNAMGNYFLKYLPSNNWALTLNVKHNSNRNNGPFPLVFGTEEAFKNPFQLSQNAITKIIDNTVNASLSANYTGRSFNFNSQTAYQSNYRYYTNPIDGDFSPIDGVTVINNYGKDWNHVNVWTQEFKFTSPAAAASPLKWTAGTYLFYQDAPTKQATHFGKDAAYVGSPDVNYALINTTKAKSSGVAFYGQAVYSFTNKLDITGGLRYDYEHKKQSILGQYQKDEDANPAFDYQPDTAATAHFSAVSPKLSLDYHLSQNHSLFASYSKGYRAGGLTPLSSDPSQPALYAFKPEYSNNTEVGIKNTFLNNRLLLNITGFYTTVTNAQVPTLVLPDAVTITKNTGRLTSKGIELEANAAPAKGLEVGYSFGYTDAKYQTLKLAQNGSEVNLKGNRQIFTPDVTSMLAAQYSYEIGKKQHLRLIVRGEWKYLGTEYFDLANSIRQSPYSLFNTRFGIACKNVEVMFWGRNLGDKKYISYAYDFGAVHLGDPKTYGVSLKVKI